jgi:hypothetical protein
MNTKNAEEEKEKGSVHADRKEAAKFPRGDAAKVHRRRWLWRCAAAQRLRRLFSAVER